MIDEKKSAELSLRLKKADWHQHMAAYEIAEVLDTLNHLLEFYRGFRHWDKALLGVDATNAFNEMVDIGEAIHAKLSDKEEPQ